MIIKLRLCHRSSTRDIIFCYCCLFAIIVLLIAAGDITIIQACNIFNTRYIIIYSGKSLRRYLWVYGATAVCSLIEGLYYFYCYLNETRSSQTQSKISLDVCVYIYICYLFEIIKSISKRSVQCLGFRIVLVIYILL